MTAPTTEPADEWDSEAAYKYVRRMIVAHQGQERPTAAPVAEARTVRGCCCDTGPLSVGRYETALAALGERDDVACGETYLGVYAARDVATAAIEWVADRETVDRQFIAAANSLEVFKE